MIRLLIRSYVATKSSVSPQSWLEDLSSRSLPAKSFSYHFDRSSGPGGQNVNKVNSKCTLTIYNFSKCDWMPQEIRNQLVSKNFRYLSPSRDCVVIQADQSRSRETNRELCLEKLIAGIKATCWFPKEPLIEDIRKWENIRRKTNHVRLEGKRSKSDKKQLRRKVHEY